MKNTFKLHVTICFILFLASQLSAQEVIPGAQHPDSHENKDVKHAVRIDAAGLILSGIGLEYQYLLSDFMAVGPQLWTGRIKKGSGDKTTTIFQEEEHRISKFGIRGTWFPSGAAKTSGAYLSGALDIANVSSQVTPSQTAAAESATVNRVGATFGAGYQLEGRTLEDGTILVVDIGALYGNGYAVKYTYSSADTPPLKTSVQDSIFLEFNLGVLF